MTVPHGDGGGGGIGSPPSAIRVESCEAEELGTIGGGGGIGSPPSAIRVESCEAEEPGPIGGGIGSPPSAVRVKPNDIEELGPIGGGIGSPPSARNNLFWPEETAEWCVIGPSETATNANTTNKLIFRKFISPPNFGKWVIPKLGYGRNASGTTGVISVLILPSGEKQS